MKYYIITLLLLWSVFMFAITESHAEDQFSISGKFELVQMQTRQLKTKEYISLTVQDCAQTFVDGFELPVSSRLVQLPGSGNYRIENLDYDYEDIHLDVKLSPFQLEFEADYSSDRWIPENIVHIARPAIMRGSRFTQISVFPVQYNPFRNVLRMITDLDIQFEIDPADRRNELNKTKTSASFSPLYEKIQGNKNPDFESGGSYLFIAPQSTVQLLQYLMRWKERLGFKTKLAVMEEIGSTAADIKNYLQNAYDNWDIPPEYVVLVGDVDGSIVVPSNYIPGYLYPWCVTDHSYTLLDGDDYFPDIMIGRLSIRDEMQLSTIISKIINYERNPYSESEWIKQALMVGHVDDWNGFSQREVLMGIRDKLLDFEYAKVDTFISPWQYGQNQLMNIINDGSSFICYRGAGSATYWSGGTSGHMLNSSNVLTLNNGFLMPFVTSMTCGGGDFAAAEAPSCFGETWLSAGTPTLPKGAIGFIGPSERDTKVWFNNPNAMGIYQGITQENIYTGGEMLLRGKMELYLNFPFGHEMGNALDSDQFYFFVYNLLGDPGLRVWTDTPKELELEAAEFYAGSNYLAATVITDADRNDFTIALTSADSLVAVGITDQAGNVNIPVSVPAGSYQLTASKYGYLPTTIDLQVESADLLVLQNYGFSAPAVSGDSLQIDLQIFNPSHINAENISLELMPQSETVSVLTAPIYHDLLLPQQTADFQFSLDLDAVWQDEKMIDLLVIMNSSFGDNIALIPLQVHSPELTMLEYEVLNEIGCILQTESTELNLTLYNSGQINSAPVQAKLICLNNLVEILSDNSWFDSIGTGETGISTSPFSVYADNNVISGETAKFSLELSSSGQVLQTVYFEIPIGLIGKTSPTFSDYGYFAIECKDSVNFETPIYDWVEIDPDQGGSGLLITPDHQIPDGYIRTISLPFQFRYFGVYYNEISICSEGYLSMGRTDQIFFRNRTIPSGTGPAAMIAPFWDSLDDGSIHVLHDNINQRFIVQWSDWSSTYDPDKKNTFQVILLNPQYHGSPSLDSEIIFQYKEIHNVDAGFHYATIGIENETQTEGLLLTFANLNAPTFHPVEAETAILFTMKTGADLPFLSIEPAELEITVSQDTIIQQSFFLQNNSADNSELSYSLSFSHFTRGSSRAMNPNRNLENDLIMQLTGYYVPLMPMDMPFYLVHNSPDGEPIIGVTLDFPAGCTINHASNLLDLQWNGETGNGAEVSWGYDGQTSISPSYAIQFVVNLEISEEMTPPLNIDWHIQGDGSGAEPHFASGTISLPATTDEMFWILYPNGGESILPGIADTIRWNHFGSADKVKLSLSRDNGSSWEILTDSADNLEYYPYVFSGPLSDRCLIKIETCDELYYDVSDDLFQITSLNIVYPTENTVMSYAQIDSLVWQDIGGLAEVDVHISIDNGFNWEKIAENVPNTGHFSFEVPGPPSDYCQLKLTNQNYFVQNVSPFFSIADSPVDWLSASSMQGIIPPGEIIEVVLSISSVDLQIGFYQANVRIETEIGQVVYLPITLNVIEDITPIAEVKLHQNAPNPFYPSGAGRSLFTRIDYEIPADSQVKMSIYNLRGQHVKTLCNDFKTAGLHSEYWDGTDKNERKVSSGVYYYLLKSGNKTRVRKMILLK